MGIVAFFGIVALIGLCVALLVCSALPLLQRGALLLGVLIACTVTMVFIGLVAASPPKFAPVQFAIALLGALPVVAASILTALVMKHFRATRLITLAWTAIVAAVSVFPGMIVLLSMACMLAGDCL